MNIGNEEFSHEEMEGSLWAKYCRHENVLPVFSGLWAQRRAIINQITAWRGSPVSSPTEN